MLLSKAVVTDQRTHIDQERLFVLFAHPHCDHDLVKEEEPLTSHLAGTDSHEVDRVPLPLLIPGLTVMQLNLRNSGHWLFTTDQYHIKENFDLDTPQGWLARDHGDWHRSNQKIKMYIKNTKPNIIFGHDIAVSDELLNCKGLQKC